MDSSRWKRISGLFAAARLLEGNRRAAFLQENCGEDQSLIDEIQSLLEIDGESGLLDSLPTASSLGIPEVVAGRFRIVRYIAEGGMGMVYEADDLQLNERVALKTIRPDIASDPDAIERFKREILLGKKVTHPNVCRIHDLGLYRAADGKEVLFLTMQFLHGETLASRIRRGPMSASEALPLIEDMIDALSAAHQAEVIHRDFKSGNVMLVHAANRTCAIVTDFGLARGIRDQGCLTRPGMMGTVEYMAPEQIKGEEVSPSTDLYALGIVMYEMVTGKRPFNGDSRISIALKHINDDPVPPGNLVPQLSAKWDEAVLGCLKKLPAERFRSAAEVKNALVHSGLGSHTRLLSRSAGLRWLAVVLLLVLAVATLFWVIRGRTDLPSEKRVVVLKFENIGGDPTNEAFCDGFMDVLSSKLTELEQFQDSLSVVPASDVRKEHVKSAKDAYRSFDANLVITGSIQRSKEGVHLIVNVVEARKLKQLRSHEMYLPQAEPTAMQEGVVKEVADLIDVAIHPDARRLLTAGNTSVPGAYEFYLQGAGYLSRGRVNTDQAIQEFGHALELDPNYALAYAGLGDAYWRKYQVTQDRQWVDLAWIQCRRAVELDPQLSEAHVTLAVLNSGTGNYSEAVQQAQQAIDINPRNFQAYSELASALDALGQTSDAEKTLTRAISLRPGDWNNHMKLATFYYKHGRYKEAESSYQEVIRLAPDNPAGYTNLGVMYHLEGREAAAQEELKQSLAVRPTSQAYSNLATVYFFEGRYADAVPLLEQLVASGSKNYVVWGNLGDAYRWTAVQADKAPPAYRRAIELAHDALKVNPQDAQALSALAIYEAKIGQVHEALSACDKALGIAPDDGTVLFNAAIASEIVGRRDNALRFLVRAIKNKYSMSEIEVEPELKALRRDPRYLEASSPIVSEDIRTR